MNNLAKRSWARAQGDDDWNIYWALPWNVRQIFNPDTGNETE